MECDTDYQFESEDSDCEEITRTKCESVYQNAFQPANDSKKHAIADHEDEMDYYYPFRGDNQCKTVDQRKMTDINNVTPYQCEAVNQGKPTYSCEPNDHCRSTAKCEPIGHCGTNTQCATISNHENMRQI